MVHTHVFQIVTLILFNELLGIVLPAVAVLACALIMSYKIKSVSKIRRQMQPNLESIVTSGAMSFEWFL